MADLLAHRVRTVALRHQTGAYIVGRPGSGKTHTVRETLDQIGANYALENARMSPAALFDLIEERSDSVIVLDDIPSLFKNPQAVQLLMAALGGDPGQPRRVTYSIKGQRRVAHFTGGIVAVSNLPLAHDPLAQAVASRVSPFEYEPTDDMLIAFVREQARRGDKGASPVECSTVVEFVIDECRSGEYRIDLRYFFKGVEDYLYGKAAGGDIWRELVRSGMRRLTPDPGDRTRAGQLARER